MQEPLADAARDSTRPSPLAVGRAEHDHVGALVLGDLVQRPRRAETPPTSEPKRRLAEHAADAAAESRSSASAIARS